MLSSVDQWRHHSETHDITTQQQQRATHGDVMSADSDGSGEEEDEEDIGSNEDYKQSEEEAQDKDTVLSNPFGLLGDD